MCDRQGTHFPLHSVSDMCDDQISANAFRRYVIPFGKIANDRCHIHRYYGYACRDDYYIADINLHVNN